MGTIRQWERGQRHAQMSFRFFQLGKDQPPGTCGCCARDDHRNRLADFLGGVIHHDHRTIREITDGLVLVLARLDEAELHLVSGGDFGVQSEREFIQAQHRDSSDTRDLGEIFVVCQQPRIQLAREIHQPRVHRSIGWRGVLLNGQVEIAHSIAAGKLVAPRASVTAVTRLVLASPSTRWIARSRRSIGVSATTKALESFALGLLAEPLAHRVAHGAHLRRRDDEHAVGAGDRVLEVRPEQGDVLNRLRQPLTVADERDDEADREQRQRMAAMRAARDNVLVAQRLDALRTAARGTDNVVPFILDCARSYCTLYELSLIHISEPTRPY